MMMMMMMMEGDEGRGREWKEIRDVVGWRKERR